VTGQARKPFRFGCLIPLGIALLGLVVLPYSFIAFLFWAAEGSWDFEGRDNWRYWTFVKGSRTERLGLIAPADKSAKYSVRLQEGNFPGWTVVIYRSMAAPDAIAEAYAKRCREMNFKVTRGPQPRVLEDDETGAELECEIEPYLDIQVYAGRKPGDATSAVSLRVWGSD
jgi:hypothetical protein